MDHYEKAKQKLNISSFNRMQIDAFEVIPTGRDTILLSLTGSGKTIAFLLPLINQIDQSVNKTQFLILAPTRELSLQITNVARSLGSGLNIVCCYGGHPIRIEKKSLESNPELVIGTPGRMLDHIERQNIDTSVIKFVVLDEFDKILEMGFHQQMQSIVSRLKLKPQYVLTSATEALEIPKFVPLFKPEIINYIHDKEIESLEIFRVNSPEKDKLETLHLLMNDIGVASTFIFCNYRETVSRISEYLNSKGIQNDFFHGGLDQMERENALSKFRNKSTTILVTTDLAGRGLDIPQVANIVHYHLPSSEEMFIHRNGRTARMEASGKVFVITSTHEEIPEFVQNVEEEYHVKGTQREISKPEWKTILINKGKRDKIRKVDVVGFLFSIGQCGKDQLGLVEIKDNYSLAGVKTEYAETLVKMTNQQKIKGKKALVRIL